MPAAVGGRRHAELQKRSIRDKLLGKADDGGAGGKADDGGAGGRPGGSKGKAAAVGGGAGGGGVNGASAEALPVALRRFAR